MKFLLISHKKRIVEEKHLIKEITPLYINREVDEKDVKKIKSFVKKTRILLTSLLQTYCC